jgi:hypothetical protein
MQTALSTRSCSCSMRPTSTSVSFRVPHMRAIRPFTAAPVHQQAAAAVAVPSPVAPQRLLVCSAAAKDATEQVWLVYVSMARADAAEQPCTRHSKVVLLLHVACPIVSARHQLATAVFFRLFCHCCIERLIHSMVTMSWPPHTCLFWCSSSCCVLLAPTGVHSCSVKHAV